MEIEINDKYDMLKLENQLCFPLYAASRQIVKLYTPYLKKLNLTYTQYITLMVLWEKGDATIKDLTQALYLDTGTMTPLLRKMEKSGLITRTRSKKDERVVNIRLTDAGWALREKALEIPPAIAGCVHLSREDAVSLYRILYQILDPGSAEDQSDDTQHVKES